MGKIVRKDQTIPDENANWREIYRMPSEDWKDIFLFDKYTKMIKFEASDTQDCIEGCYLLLSIQISQIGKSLDDFKFYPFSIIAKINPYIDIPKIIFGVNEFIIGNLQKAEIERINQFYEVWLPHDSNRVEFDFQSELAGLYINIGNEKMPNIKNFDFKLIPPRIHSILTLDKISILQKAESNKIEIPVENSLENINLVIGIWTDKIDSLD